MFSPPPTCFAAWNGELEIPMEWEMEEIYDHQQISTNTKPILDLIMKWYKFYVDINSQLSWHNLYVKSKGRKEVGSFCVDIKDGASTKSTSHHMSRYHVFFCFVETTKKHYLSEISFPLCFTCIQTWYLSKCLH